MHDPQRFSRLEQLFHEARKLPEKDRTAFFARECCGDSALVSELKSLLDHAGSDAEFIQQQERAAAEVASLLLRPSTLDRLQGQQIGPFRIRRFLAAGGMGVVYEAEQEQPQRVVALKLLRQRIANHSAHRRFQNEIEVLGRLNHPGIAQIYQAGVHEVEVDDGPKLHVPYFAMELVDGARCLTEHVLAEGLSFRAIIELMVEVCDAVHYGHTQGFVHRDLKPANLLVGKGGKPRVIDFGVARAIDSEQTLPSATETGKVVGTVRYMSPEQWDPERAIDGRSDVFSLGTILFELLAGQLPYEVPSDSPYQAAVAIRELVPRRPSELKQELRGDLEVILMKCLEKDPAQRYESAQALAQDLRCWLEDRPILARTPGFLEQAFRLVRRHRAAAALALLFLLALVGGLAGTSVGYLRALEAEEIARNREAEATELRAAEATQRLKVQEALDLALLETQRAEKLTGFLTQMISSPRPDRGGYDMRLVDLLTEIEERLSEALPESPNEQVTVLMILAHTHETLGDFPKSERNYRAALALLEQHFPRDSRIGRALVGISNSLHFSHRIEESRDLALQTRARLQSTGQLSADLDMMIARSLAASYAKLDQFSECDRELSRGMKLLDQVTEAPLDRGFPYFTFTLPRCFHELALLNVKAVLYDRQGFPEKVVDTTYQQLEMLGDCDFGDDSLAPYLRFRLATALSASNRPKEAEPHIRQALAEMKGLYGGKHSLVLSSQRFLGQLLFESLNKPGEAVNVLQECWAMQREAFGDFERDTLLAQASLGAAMVRHGSSLEGRSGLSILEESFDLFCDFYGIADSGALVIARRVLDSLFEARELDSFDELTERLIDVEPSTTIAAIERCHALILAARHTRAQGKFEEAHSILQNLRIASEQRWGTDHPTNLDVYYSLANLYGRWGKLAEQTEMLSQAAALKQRLR